MPLSTSNPGSRSNPTTTTTSTNTTTITVMSRSILVSLLLLLLCASSSVVALDDGSGLSLDSVRSSAVLELRSTAPELSLIMTNTLNSSMIAFDVRLLLADSAAATSTTTTLAPSVEVSLLFQPQGSPPESAPITVSVVSVPSLEIGVSQVVAQSYSTCSSIYVPSSNSNVNVGDKLGAWSVQVSTSGLSATQELSAEVDLLAVQGALQQMEEWYTTLAAGSVNYYDIVLPSLPDTNLTYDVAVYVSGSPDSTDDPSSWVLGVAARPASCPEFSSSFEPLNITGQLYTNVSNPVEQATFLLRNMQAGVWHLAVQVAADAAISHREMNVRYIAVRVIPPSDKFWITEHIVAVSILTFGLAVFFGSWVTAGIALYNKHRRNYQSL